MEVRSVLAKWHFNKRVTFLVAFFILVALLLLFYIVAVVTQGVAVEWINLPLTLILQALFFETPLVFLFVWKSKIGKSLLVRILHSTLFIFLYLFTLYILFMMNMVAGTFVLGTIDCGGIDPGFSAECRREDYGHKRTCTLFQCRHSASESPSSFPPPGTQ